MPKIKSSGEASFCQVTGGSDDEKVCIDKLEYKGQYVNV